MVYIEVRSSQDLDDLIQQINRLHFGEESLDFLKKEGRMIYGYFVNNEDEVINEKTLIVFGDYLSPNDIKPVSPNSIFAKVKVFGSSKNFRGLMATNGQILLHTQFESINSLLDTRLVGTLKGKSAVICSDGSLMSPIKYDRLYNAGENTIAFEIDGKCGFMNSNAEIVIDAEYECGINYTFENGYVLVNRKFDEALYQYRIDHYGLMVSEMVCISDNYELYAGNTGYYPYGDLPDYLDAYDGDESNCWNTD